MHSLPGLARQLGVAAAWYKDEASRFGLGSFKALGGAYGVLRVLRNEVARALGRDDASSLDLLTNHYRSIANRFVVTTATDGNHGRSVAWGARMFGCRCVIYLPHGVSPGREQAIRALGAEIVRSKHDYDDTVRQCARDADREDRIVVSDTSYPGYEAIPSDVMQGYTVLAAEALEQLPAGTRPTHVFLQAGVGGLAAAVVAHLWEAAASGGEEQGERPINIIVEPESADCLFQTARAGHLARARGNLETVMAGLSCGETSSLAWRILKHGADAFMTITDQHAIEAMRLLAQGVGGDRPIVSGESAAAGVAGALAAANDAELRAGIGLGADARVLFIGTEGATDPVIYEKLVGRTPDAIAAATP